MLHENKNPTSFTQCYPFWAGRRNPVFSYIKSRLSKDGRLFCFPGWVFFIRLPFPHLLTKKVRLHTSLSIIDDVPDTFYARRSYQNRQCGVTAIKGMSLIGDISGIFDISLIRYLFLGMPSGAYYPQIYRGGLS